MKEMWAIVGICVLVWAAVGSAATITLMQDECVNVTTIANITNMYCGGSVNHTAEFQTCNVNYEKTLSSITDLNSICNSTNSNISSLQDSVDTLRSEQDDTYDYLIGLPIANSSTLVNCLANATYQALLISSLRDDYANMLRLRDACLAVNGNISDCRDDLQAVQGSLSTCNIGLVKTASDWQMYAALAFFGGIGACYFILKKKVDTRKGIETGVSPRSGI